MLKFVSAALLLSFCSVLGAANDFVVIGSESRAIENGKIFDHKQIVNLATDESITLLSASGEIIELTGPFNGLIETSHGSAKSSLVESISRLVKYSADDDFSLAAYRSLGLSGQLLDSEIWGIDINVAGQQCWRGDQDIFLLWPDAFKGANISLANQSSQQEVQFRWPGREKVAGWPADLPIEAGISYSVKIDMSSQALNFELAMLPNELKQDIDKVVWMFEHDCQRQALQLFKRVINQPRHSS